MKVVDLAGYGLEGIAAVTAGLYTTARLQRDLRKTDDEKPVIHSGTAAGFEAWNSSATNDTEEPTANKLLMTWGDRFKDPYSDMLQRWGEWIWDKLGFLGWAKILLFIPVLLALLLLVTPWMLLRLPFLIVTFLLDRNNDFRLRIIVLSFGLG